jgi:hypothetical protein
LVSLEQVVVELIAIISGGEVLTDGGIANLAAQRGI